MNLKPTLYELTLSASKGPQGLSYRFSGIVQSLASISSSSGVPKLVLGDLDFSLSYAADTKGYDISLGTKVWLVPRDYPSTLASLLEVSVEYQTDIDDAAGIWKVIGTASSIRSSTIYYLFDSDSNDAVMDMLAHLVLPFIYVQWDYSSGQADLSVEGTLLIGPFELDLGYQYLHSAGAGQSAWSFQASLGTYSSQPYTLSTLIHDLSPDPDVVAALTEVPFVGGIVIPSASPQLNSDPPVQLYLSKQPGRRTMMWLQITTTTAAGNLSFTYVQLQGTRSAPAPGVTSTTPPGYKRMIRVMLDRLPTIPSVPVVGHIDQPVDSIDYVWVGDSTVDPSTSATGIKLSELSMINAAMTPQNQIPYRAARSTLQANSPSNSSLGSTDPYVLLAGHHFIVGANNAVIIDHLFGSSARASPSSTLVSSRAVTNAAVAKTAPVASKSIQQQSNQNVKGTSQANQPRAIALLATSDPSVATSKDSGSTTMAPLSRSFGPFLIQNVGLQTKDGYLYLLIDATVSLGPIQLSIKGVSYQPPTVDIEYLTLGLVRRRIASPAV